MHHQKELDHEHCHRGPDHHRGGCEHHHHGHGPGPHGRGRRARRGDVRLALLSLLLEEESTGYGLIRQIEDKSAGTWKASPGSVYPNLAQLVDEGLVAAADEGQGRSRFSITDAGRDYVHNHSEEVASIWAETDSRRERLGPLFEAVGELRQTLKAIGREGSPEQRKEAAEKVRALTEELKSVQASGE